MLTPVLLLALAALVWPGATARARVRPPTTLVRWAPPVGPGVPVMSLAAVLGALVAGTGGALAAALAAATGWTRWRARGLRRERAVLTSGLVDALGLLVAELRAGAHPAAAAEAAARDACPAVATALAGTAAAARLGGDVPAVLRATGGRGLRPWLDRLANAWTLADRHGVALADLLDAVRTDVEHRARFAADVEARLAGPRATAAVLAGLPVLGLALGEAIGAAPLRVLATTGPGQVLLVLGTGLGCAGVWWSARIVNGAVPS